MLASNMAASSSIILPSGIGLVFNNNCDAEDVPDGENFDGRPDDGKL